MGMLDSLKINRAIQVLLSDQAHPDAERRQALATLKQLGKKAVPKLMGVVADPQSSPKLTELLTELLDNATLPLFLEGLSSKDSRVVSRVMAALCSGRNYDPNRLLVRFKDPDIPKARVAEVLSRHKHVVNPKTLLRLLDTAEPETRTLILRLVDEAATESIAPELIRRLDNEDWQARLCLARTLCRFNTDATRDALTRLLEDQHKAVRQAALEGLAGCGTGVDLGAVCKRLRDPDLAVQTKAIETIVKINDPGAVHHLLDILQDESEYVRRAAVEVLNHVGNSNAIRDLLGALRDRDWWVRVRAADALGTIGGPKVIEAAISLIKDKDEFVRRCVIEILNSSRAGAGNETVFRSLVDALGDEDWWVRERAIDALASMGDRRAVPPLLSVMEKDSKAAPVAIRALASLGDPQAIPPVLAALRGHDKAVKAEAFRALATLTDGAHAEMVHRALTEELSGLTGELRDLAERSLRTVNAKFGSQIRGVDATATEVRQAARPSQSLLRAEEPTAPHASLMTDSGQWQSASPPAQAGASPPAMDPALLEPGVVLADRYRVLRHIGSGAFGVVILAEDLVVCDEIILKFLKPHVASDANVIQRFIQELRYARRITHENVIRIHDFIAVGASYAISMEYFPSRSLASLLTPGAGMPIRRAFPILRDICRGMAVAHRAGIIHRDLKPANVLVNEDDLVKIVDFGLAAATSKTDSGLTRTGLILGTPFYIAPEQAQGGAVDPRTDIYSLGVIAYELLTGRPPYTGPDPVSILLQHVQGKPAPPKQVNPALSPALEATILKAMALGRPERYQSMEELGEALHATMALENA